MNMCSVHYTRDSNRRGGDILLLVYPPLRPVNCLYDYNCYLMYTLCLVFCVIIIARSFFINVIVLTFVISYYCSQRPYTHTYLLYIVRNTYLIFCLVAFFFIILYPFWCYTSTIVWTVIIIIIVTRESSDHCDLTIIILYIVSVTAVSSLL